MAKIMPSYCLTCESLAKRASVYVIYKNAMIIYGYGCAVGKR
jgi:hypothetical protein